MVQLKKLIMLSLSRRIGVNDSTVQSELEVTYEFSSSVRDCITSLRRWLIVALSFFVYWRSCTALVVCRRYPITFSVILYVLVRCVGKTVSYKLSEEECLVFSKLLHPS